MNSILGFGESFVGTWNIIHIGLNFLLHSSILLAMGLILSKALHRRGAAFQSAILRTTLCLVFLSPLLSVTFNSIGIPGLTISFPQTMDRLETPLIVDPDFEPSQSVESLDFSTTMLETLAPQIDQQPASFMESAMKLDSPPSSRMAFSWNINALWILWAFISTGLMIRLWIRYRSVRRLRRKAWQAETIVIERCQSIADEQGISCPTILNHSSVHSPFLTGYRRPAILCPPADGENSLISREVILHELAHMIRRDILWNYLCRLSECLFFFQPLLWTLNRQIETTGDHVCDDYVMQHSPNRSSYANQLVGLAERYQMTPMENAIGLGVISFHSSLGQRVLRIMDRSRTLTLRVGRMAIAMILLSGLTGSIFIGLTGFKPGTESLLATEKQNTTLPDAEKQMQELNEKTSQSDASSLNLFSPDSLRNIDFIVRKLANEGREQEVEDYLKQVNWKAVKEQNIPVQSDNFQVLISKMLQYKVECDYATELSQKCAELNPENLVYQSNYQVTLMLQSRLKDALESIEATLKIDPHFAYSLIHKAYIQRVLGRYDESYACLYQILQNEPGHSVAQSELSLLYQAIRKNPQENSPQLLKELEALPIRRETEPAIPATPDAPPPGEYLPEIRAEWNDAHTELFVDLQNCRIALIALLLPDGMDYTPNGQPFDLKEWFDTQGNSAQLPGYNQFRSHRIAWRKLQMGEIRRRLKDSKTDPYLPVEFLFSIQYKSARVEPAVLDMQNEDRVLSPVGGSSHPLSPTHHLWVIECDLKADSDHLGINTHITYGPTLPDPLYIDPTRFLQGDKVRFLNREIAITIQNLPAEIEERYKKADGYPMVTIPMEERPFVQFEFLQGTPPVGYS